MDAGVHQPLIRSDGVRALLVAALGLAALLAVPAAWFLALFDPPGWLLPAAVAALLAAPFAGSAIAAGRWSRTRELRWLQAVAFAVLLGVGALVALAGAEKVLDELTISAPIATSSDALPNGLVYVGGALIAIALLLAATPLPITDVAARTLVVICVGPAAFLIGSAVLVQETTVGCGGYRLDWERWQRDVPEGGSDATISIAAALVRCETLDGATRAEVREVLGRPQQVDRSGRSWSWQVGWVNDTFGLGDGEVLTVAFRDGRVRDARLRYGS